MKWSENVTRVWAGEVYTGFWWGNLKERDHLEDLGVDGKIILIWIFRNVMEHGVAQDRDRWRAVVNAALNLLVSYNGRNLVTSWGRGNFSGGTLLHEDNSEYL